MLMGATRNATQEVRPMMIRRTTGTTPAPDDLRAQVFDKLARSTFRSRFSLCERDLSYVSEKGLDVVMLHARKLLETRLFPAHIPNDGKQTPMRGHPVFVAQHATATCCRNCLAKWHGIPAGHPLLASEQAYVLDVMRAWIEKQAAAAGPVCAEPSLKQQQELNL
jgi:hypothetical protein